MQLKTTISKKKFMENLNNSIIKENKELINTIFQKISNKSFNNDIEKMQFILKELDFFNFISIDKIPFLVIETFSNSIRFNLCCNNNDIIKYKSFFDKIIIDYDYKDKLINDSIFTDGAGHIADIFWCSFETLKCGWVGYRFDNTFNYDDFEILTSADIIEDYHNNINSYQFYTIVFLFYYIINQLIDIYKEYHYYILINNYDFFDKNNCALKTNKIKFINNCLYNNNVKNDFLHYSESLYKYNNIELNINANNTVIILDSLINNNLNFSDFSITMENKE